ncbi:MAG: hypothetical protein E7157_04655 [Lactobacillales bacterium]|nr:hypothetical protein [Lactobacillales bacterium]
MFTNITIGKYIYKESIIHKIHPIIKIIMLLFIIFLSLISSYKENIILLAYVLLISILTKINIKTYLKNIYGLRYLIISILFINLIFNVSVLNSINSIEKLIIIFIYSSILMYTTTINEINLAFNKLLSPLKRLTFDVDNISLILTISIKFITTIFEEVDILFKAFKSRGYKFNGSVKDRINKVKNFLSTLFYLLLKKSDDIGTILEIKNYNLKKIVKRNKRKIKIKEYLILVINIILLIIIKKVV